MAVPSTYTPPSHSLAREFVEAFFTLFVGAFVQAGRFVRLIGLKIRRASARRTLFRKAVAMGGRMEQAGAGDQLILQHLGTSTEPKQRDLVLARLGEMGLEPEVPLMGLEEDYQAGHEAYRRCRQAEHDHDEAAYRLVPHSALGWFALLSSYVLTVFAVLLVAAFFFPDKVPASIARLVGRGTRKERPTPEARFDDVLVEVIGARIGRSDAPAGGGKLVVVDEQPHLFIRLRITNGGSSPVEYQSWRGKFSAGEDVPAKVNDDRGSSLHRLVNRNDVPPEGGIRTATIAPGNSVEDVLVYAPPAVGFKRLDVFLPGESIGKKGMTKQLSLTPEHVQMPERPGNGLDKERCLGQARAWSALSHICGQG